MAERKLICTLCGYELENNLLAENLIDNSISNWYVCFSCRHIQNVESVNKIWKKFIKRAGLYLYILLMCKTKKIKKRKQKGLFQKQTCSQCHSNNLLEWDGQCPRCGSNFIYKGA